jgi:hypothetical protein
MTPQRPPPKPGALYGARPVPVRGKHIEPPTLSPSPVQRHQKIRFRKRSAKP